MATTAKQKIRKGIIATAQQILDFAQKRAPEVADWLELHFALFGAGGKADKLFPTEAERAAFLRTTEYKQLLALMDRLPASGLVLGKVDNPHPILSQSQCS